MESFKRHLLRFISALAVSLIVGEVGMYSWASAQDIPAIIDIKPLPDQSRLSPVVDEDGLFIAPRSGPLELLEDPFIVIGDMRFRMASSIRFLKSRNGFWYDRANFKPGTFVEYLVNDDREVTAVWPSAEF